MAYLSDFEYDVFISYAHADNTEDAQGVRWVSLFRTQLIKDIRSRLGCEVAVYFDEQAARTNDDLLSMLEKAARSGLLLIVFSPSWVESREGWTIRELGAFCAAGSPESRIFIAEIYPVEEERHPAQIRGKLRTKFYWQNRRGDVVTVKPNFAPENDPWKFANDLASLGADMVKQLKKMRAGPRANAPGSSSIVGKTVLLARVPEDARPAWRSVRSYLVQFGVNVLPADEPPEDDIAFANGFKSDLRKADLFVQLFKELPSMRLEGLPGKPSYARHQYETAKSDLRRVLQWRHPEIKPEAIKHWDTELLEGPDVLAIGLEEFKRKIKETLETLGQPPKPDRGSFFFIHADRSDKDLAKAILKVLEENKRPAALPVFDGLTDVIDKDLEESLKECGGLFIVYRNASPAWVRSALRRYFKYVRPREIQPDPKVILFVPPPPKDETELDVSIADFERIYCDEEETRIVQRVRTLLEK